MDFIEQTKESSGVSFIGADETGVILRFGESYGILVVVKVVMVHVFMNSETSLFMETF